MCRDLEGHALGRCEVAAVQRDPRLEQARLVTGRAALGELGQRRRQVIVRELLAAPCEPRLVVWRAPPRAGLLERRAIQLAEGAATRRVQLRCPSPGRGRVFELVGSLAPVMQREMAAAE